MLDKSPAAALLVSADAVLVHRVANIFASMQMRVEVLAGGDALLAYLASIREPGLVLLDVRLPGLTRGDLLAALHDADLSSKAAVALIADDIDNEMAELWHQRLRDGVLDDIIPRHADRNEWAARIVTLRRAHAMRGEITLLRESALRQAQQDRITGSLNREAMLGLLFRETDRVQRLRTSLCLILMDIDDFGHWNAQLGSVVCDELLRLVTSRIEHILRSYDTLGRIGGDEFLMILPGCSLVNAQMLAERLRIEVFSEPFDVDLHHVRLTGCFGVTSSGGRSPVVVLLEAEQAAAAARQGGPDRIRCVHETHSPKDVALHSLTSGPEPGLPMHS